MLQTNSAAHVPNTNMNLINEDTHNCDLNLYETIFQNVCLIDNLSSMTPTHDANACCETSTDPSFTDCKSTHLGDAPSEDNLRGIKTSCFTGSNLESTLDQGLSTKDLFGHPPKNLFFYFINHNYEFLAEFFLDVWLNNTLNVMS